MVVLERSIVALQIQIKHLPGRHNQLAHGNRFGSASASSSGPLAGATSPYDRMGKLEDGYAEQLSNLSEDQTNSIRAYTGGHYSKMNGILRGTVVKNKWNSDQIDEYQEQIKLATDGLNTGSAPFAFQTLRGINLMPEHADKLFEQFTKSKGKTFTDPAFISSTANDKTSFGDDIQFQIHVPKGAKGMHVGLISLHPGENEFLMPPGSKFKVLGTEEKKIWGGTQRIVVLGLLKTPAKKKSFEELEQKHLPGRHNQRTHGNRFGSSAASEKGPLKESMNDIERRKVMQEEYRGWVEGLDSSENEALHTYTSMSYIQMNNQLRTGMDMGFGDQINEATAALKKVKTPFAFTAVRNVHFDGADALWKQFQDKKSKTFVDPAFVSTSTNNISKYDGGESTVMIKIHVPKGAHGGYVHDISDFPSENEFLLPPKSRFKVIRTYLRNGTQRVAEIALLKEN